MPLRTVFADTSYWLAITNPNDQWRNLAIKAKKSLGQVRILTTDEVLIEHLNGMAGYGPCLRQKTAEVIRAIKNDPNVTVLQQSRETFLKGLDRYEKRADKSCGLTDCISMNAMDQEGIRDVLTGDDEFRQEGYNVLMRNDAGSARGADAQG